MDKLFYLCDLFGVAVFAIAGALVAGRKSMDLFGVIVIAVITALGGGTLRDIILGNNYPVWIRDETYIIVACVAALGTVLWVKVFHLIHETTLLVADAFGLAVFTVIGTNVALMHNVPISTALIMGIMTGVAGGVIRDIICNEIPLIFHKEIYATACLAGSAIFIMLHYLTPVYYWVNTFISIFVVLAIRLAAIRWHLALPHFKLIDNSDN